MTKIDTILIILMTFIAVAFIPVLSKVMGVIIGLEQAVIFYHPISPIADERAQNRGRDQDAYENGEKAEQMGVGGWGLGPRALGLVIGYRPPATSNQSPAPDPQSLVRFLSPLLGLRFFGRGLGGGAKYVGGA